MLLDRGDSDKLSIIHKLDIDKHLKVKKQDRQRVYLAAELLSTSTANALQIMYPNNSKMQNLSKFIRLIDSWFDVFNRLVSVA